MATEPARAPKPPKKLKKPSKWMEAAQGLPKLAPGIPPSKEGAAAQRTARLALVRQFWPGVSGTGGRDVCHACRWGATRYAWKACRGRGGGTRNAHGPNVPDWPALAYPLGCRVRCCGFEGIVTSFDESTGFFTVACDDGTVQDVFLSHAAYEAEVGTCARARGRVAHAGRRRA